MLEFESNEDLDVTDLAGFFGRIGWDASQGEQCLEWVLESSDEWIVCRLEGELVGFGRTFRLDPRRKIMFDVVVDERFKVVGLAEEIVRRLSLAAAGPTEFEVFRPTAQSVFWHLRSLRWRAFDEVREAPPDAYTG